MSPRRGYKQTAEHIRNSALAKKARRQVAECPMDFNAARAYLTRINTAPDTDLTPEERLIKRMGQKGQS